MKRMDESTWIVSVDLGFFADHTVISILKRIQRFTDAQFESEENERAGLPIYQLQKLEVIPLKTEYPTIAARAAEIMDRLPVNDEANKNDPNPHIAKILVIDRTGAEGSFQLFPIYADPWRRTIGISITAGSGYTRVSKGYHVAKTALVSTLIAVAQAKQPEPFKGHRLEIAPGIADAKNLVDEFQSFQLKQSDSGNVQYSGKSGKHDDIVLSIAMGIWIGEHACHRIEAMKNPFDYAGQVSYGPDTNANTFNQ